MTRDLAVEQRALEAARIAPVPADAPLADFIAALNRIDERCRAADPAVRALVADELITSVFRSAR